MNSHASRNVGLTIGGQSQRSLLISGSRTRECPDCVQDVTSTGPPLPSSDAYIRIKEDWTFIDWNHSEGITLTSPHFDPSSYERGFITSAYAGIFLCSLGIGLNLLLFAILLSSRKLRFQFTYAQILNIALADLSYIVTVDSFTVYFELHSWRLGAVFCKTWMILDVILPGVSLFGLLLLNMDRIVFAYKTSLYQRLMQRRALRIVVLFCPWFISCVIVNSLWLGFPAETEEHLPGACVYGITKEANVASMCLTVFFPYMLIFVLLVFIFIAGIGDMPSVRYDASVEHGVSTEASTPVRPAIKASDQETEHTATIHRISLPAVASSMTTVVHAGRQRRFVAALLAVDVISLAITLPYSAYSQDQVFALHLFCSTGVDIPDISQHLYGVAFPNPSVVTSYDMLDGISTFSLHDVQTFDRVVFFILSILLNGCLFSIILLNNFTNLNSVQGQTKEEAVIIVKSVMPDTFVEGFHDVTKVGLMPYRLLGTTGLQVSALSFGASSLGSVFHSTDETESLEVVKTAITSGINYVDTAPWYGHGKSESVLGKILPAIPRSSYYIATKVGRYDADINKMFDFSAERTLQSVDESLQRLGLQYVDIIQVHDMEFAHSLDVILNETLPALQKVKDAGKAKFIGITGYPLDNFKTILERSHVPIDTILTYCRASMNDNSLKEWLPYFHGQGVGVVNASPISMGLLSNRGPPSWHPASSTIKKVCSEAASYCNDNSVDISRLGLKFTLSQEDIPTTLVSTASCDNLVRNIDSVYSPLSDKEQEVLEEVMERYMKPLKNANWEGVEVAEYRRLLAEQQKGGHAI